MCVYYKKYNHGKQRMGVSKEILMKKNVCVIRNIHRGFKEFHVLTQCAYIYFLSKAFITAIPTEPTNTPYNLIFAPRIREIEPCIDYTLVFLAQPHGPRRREENQQKQNLITIIHPQDYMDHTR